MSALVYFLLTLYLINLIFAFISALIVVKQDDNPNKNKMSSNNKIIMDDYDAGFADATKLMQEKLDAMLFKYELILKEYDYIEEARDVALLEEVKQKLFEK
jgi:hypothetical protein